MKNNFKKQPSINSLVREIELLSGEMSPVDLFVVALWRTNRPTFEKTGHFAQRSSRTQNGVVAC